MVSPGTDPGFEPGPGPEPDPATDPDADDDARDLRRIEPGLGRVRGVFDVGKAAVPVVVGTLVVSVPYVLVVSWMTNTLLSVAGVLTPEIAHGVVVFLTLTTFSSLLFSAVMLVECLLPWESPLAL